jgi:RimJ/RimL family protein N-acetyltransferase
VRPIGLGWRSHLIFPRFDAEVLPRDDCVVVRTAANPTFWWGNFLLFDHPPREGDAAHWMARFAAEIAAGQPESRHVAFGVDSDRAFGMPADFIAAGFSLATGTVLTLQAAQLRVPAWRLPAGFRFAALDLPRQSAIAIEMQVATDAGATESPDSYRLFRTRQMARYSAMDAAGLGHWFGVFAATGQAEALVADCGLFRTTDAGVALGRFQHVSTHPAWRRRGLCRALIDAVCRHGFEAMGLDTLVIVADPDDVAIHAYEQVGFVRHSDTWCLERKPPG